MFVPVYFPLIFHFHSALIQLQTITEIFSKNRPSGPILSISQNVRPCVRLSVSLSVRLFTFEVTFKRLFASTSQSLMSKIFRNSECTALHQSLSKYLTAQDTRGTPTQTKHNRTLARLGNLLYLQSWYTLKMNRFFSSVTFIE